jgi:hypothetical protein
VQGSSLTTRESTNERRELERQVLDEVETAWRGRVRRMADLLAQVAQPAEGGTSERTLDAYERLFLGADATAFTVLMEAGAGG